MAATGAQFLRYADRRVRSYSFPALDGGAGLVLRATSEHEALRSHLSTGGGFSGLDLTGRVLRGLDLGDVDLSGARLANADLRGCRVSFAKFDRADLSGADMAGAFGDGASFEGALIGLHGDKPTVLDGADIPGATFRGARITGASFGKARLERSDFSEASVVGAEFRGARLGDVEHARASYRDCDFAKADLRALAGGNRRGVTRRDRTVDTLAVANRYEGALLDDVVPALTRDRRLSSVSKALAVGLAGAAVAGAVTLAGHALGLGTEALRHAVDLPSLAERLEALLHYRDVADLLTGTAPVRWALDHAAGIAGVVVSGALLLKDKAAGHVKDRLTGRVRALIDTARPHVAEVARRCGNVAGTVAAFVRAPGAAGVILRGLSETGAQGERGLVRSACLGDTTVVACTGEHLNRAMEWIATSLGREDRIGHDVLLVRDRTGDDAAPVAIRLDAPGGMTAFWKGPDGLRVRSWKAEEMACDPASPWGALGLPEDGPDATRRAFENAILRDHLPGLDFDYVEGRGRVAFGDGGRVAVSAMTGSGAQRSYEGVIDADDAPPAPRR